MASNGNLWQLNLKFLLLILLRVPGEVRGSSFKILLTYIITRSIANYG